MALLSRSRLRAAVLRLLPITILSALGFAGAAAGCAAGGDTLPDGTGGQSTGACAGGSDAGVEDTGLADVAPDIGPVDCVDATDCVVFNGPCTTGACVNGTCQSQADNEFGSCNDGQFCTADDVCQQGVCVGGTARFCPSLDACHVGACNEELDTCENVAGNDGGQCDDMNPCTTVGLCNSGICTSGLPINCSIFDSQCTVGGCDPVVGCKALPANQGAPCDDGLFCNVNETCQNGSCGGGQSNPCAPPGGCYIASCSENGDMCTAVPGNDGAACDDLSNCTADTTCLNGACLNGQPANDGAVCDDGTDCTTGEICNGGACGGGVGPQIYFAEDFADNAQGWVLGPEWQIGAATASMDNGLGTDPATDHSPTNDDGVAGVVIGGNASTNLHDYYFIESPPFNTENAPAQVVLGFYRWLNSDWEPYMNNVIDIWNGVQWVRIWNSVAPPNIIDTPPQGLGWTFIEHDITAHQNAGMRVRFGFNIDSMGVFTIGSWNVDDVLIASAACP